MKLPRNAQIWMPGYLRSRLRNHNGRSGLKRVWLSICDHYEPFWQNQDEKLASERVAAWRRTWPEIAKRHRDSRGQIAKYTFFYPQEEYRPHLLDQLAEMTREGSGDVEVHIHHDGEGRQNFIDRMAGFIEVLSQRHGLLRKQNGKTIFGFIHGLWALDNSRPDGRCCGLNDEISILRDLGCYADYGMPSGSSATQARTVNTIYWCTDDPQKSKSYDTGVPVVPGNFGRGDLLIIPGPLGLRWRERLLPRLETGELAGYDLATRYRVQRWLACAPQIGEDVFIKLFTHGCQERNSGPLLGGGFDRALDYLQTECQERGYELRFASAWEMYQGVKAAAERPSGGNGGH
jgi:hypothetical protein